MANSRLSPVQKKFCEIVTKNIKENESSCSDLQV